MCVCVCVCVCECMGACVSDGKLRSFIAVFCPDLHTPQGPGTSQLQFQHGRAMQ